MTSTKTTDERAEVQGRLDAISARIETRAGEIDDIEARQLASATAGDAPDPALATAKAALVDAQSIDERAAAAVRGHLDQIDAAAQRERDLARLAQLRRDIAAKAREAHEAGDAIPAALDAAMAAVRAAGVALHAHVTRTRQLQSDAERLAGDARTLAHELGEPVDPDVTVDHVDRAYRSIPQSDLPRLRALNGAGRRPVDAVREVAAAVVHRLEVEASAANRSSFY